MIKLVEQQQHTLTTAFDHAHSIQTQVSALALYGRGVDAEAPDAGGVQEVTNPYRIRELLDSAPVLATGDMLWMRPLPTVPHAFSASVARNAMARGKDVTVRAIHQSSAADSTRTATHLKELTDMGVRLRSAPLLPFRMLVVDETMALVAPAESADPPERLVLVRSRPAVAVLRQVFEFCWDRTTDLREPAAPRTCARTGQPLRLTEQQVLILQLWARGRKDSAIARDLQVSPRTLRRMVSSLLRRLGVSSRFEAGMVAARASDLLEVPAQRLSDEELTRAG
ncbi:helix-turn-helix transcriptional regulator [Saccharothrix syringae]|uniref:helix-turn-helix transcriptional regulator n=1 Tax=Saccharothrix syringae TaxID=103733 RepID=UPI001293A5A0|nr:helix-turn-helix transcriptional regulator [Saccharothrix syringae]